MVIRAVGVSNQTTKQKNQSDDIQANYYYFSFTSKPDGSLAACLLFQKVDIGGETWIVKSIIGTEDISTAKTEKDDCAICYSEKADIVSLPCRHLAIGLDCAKKIKANKEDKNARDCPVCRVSKQLVTRNREIH